jgi:hypothetical protein
MSQIAHQPGYHQIQDQLDFVGQKYRVQQILRGIMLCGGVAILSSLAAMLAAHFTRQSHWTYLILALWGASVVTSVVIWFLKPLFIRPDPMVVARFIEARVEGLHNGLTNGLLLARRDDIAQSPWLPQIYEEIVHTTSGKPLGSAVKIRDLRPLALWLSVFVVPAVLAFAVFPKPFIHGWNQLFNPSAFAPTLGAAKILDVQPKDVTLVAGQPLEISLSAQCPGEPSAHLIFEALPVEVGQTAAPAPANTELSPASKGDADAITGLSTLKYGYRAPHVDAPLRYRLEVAGTQSPWYTVTIVKQVKLTSIGLRISAPTYTRIDDKTIELNADDVAKTPVVVAQGSKVELRATVDVPAGSAMLQLGDGSPQPMQSAPGTQGRQFIGSIVINDDTPLTVLLAEGGQVIARVPEQAFVIHCTKDNAPNIEMTWPTQDATIPLNQELKVSALLRDDYGVTSAKILFSTSADASVGRALPANPNSAGSARPTEDDASKMTVAREQQFGDSAGVKAPQEFTFVLPVDASVRKHGGSVKILVQATDNRRLPSASQNPTEGGPQTSTSQIFEIKFEDADQIAKEQLEHGNSLREKLTEMLKLQQDLYTQTTTLKAENAAAFKPIGEGQANLRGIVTKTAETVPFTPDELKVQKALLMLSFNETKDAMDLAASLQTEPALRQRIKLDSKLQGRQKEIINLLQTLLQISEPTTQPSHSGADLLSAAEQFKKLDEALKKYMQEQQKLLTQTAALAKKPVDNWDDNDKKKLEDLKQSQDKLDQFMQQQIKDFSKLLDQDMANSSMLQQLMEVYSEVTMAKDALKQKAAEMAVAAEDNGIGKASEISQNIEKWLANAPDRTKWLQEDPLAKADLPMPELPKELEDLVGKLLEQEEDLMDQAEDQNANYANSSDKGIGWDATDGPIADMTAKGVTGNALPNNNDMNGRSGEGRSGKSQGEFAEDHASGKGGRRTPTRLDPTPFQKGQIKDDSKDPVGGATGGGKMSGQGGEGLTGPVPPKQKQQMERLANKQAEIRNAAEKLHLQYQLGRYDNFKLLDSIALMRSVETDLKANRYQNAMHKRDLAIQSLDASRMLLGSQVHVQRDTSPTTDRKTQEQINDAMKGELPPAWSEALKEYYKKLSQ